MAVVQSIADNELAELKRLARQIVAAEAPELNILDQIGTLAACLLMVTPVAGCAKPIGGQAVADPDATRTRSSRVRLPLPCPVSRTTCPSPQLLNLSAGPMAHRPWCPTDRAYRQYVLHGNTRDAAARFRRRQAPAARVWHALVGPAALGVGLAPAWRAALRRRPRGGAGGG